MAELSGKRIAFLVAQEGVEEVELTKPWEAVKEAGGAPVLIAPESGEVQAFNHLDKGSTFSVDETLADAQPGKYDGVVLPEAWPIPINCAPRRTRCASCSSSSQKGSPWA